MAIFDYFKSNKKKTASLAKERLQIIVAHERKDRSTPDYLPQLKREIVEVVSKYVKISEKDITLAVDSDGGLEVLELNVTLNDK